MTESATFAMGDEALTLLSHDLRTPLTKILGYGELLAVGALDGDLRPDQARAVAIICQQAKTLARAVDMLMQLQTLSAEQLAWEPVNLARMVSAIVPQWQEQARVAGVHLTVQADPSVPFVRGDVSILCQLVHWLLDMAIQCAQRGAEVALQVQPCDDAVCLAIEDTAHRANAIKPTGGSAHMSLSDASTTALHYGMGLGLMLARHITALHRGHLFLRGDGQNPIAAIQVTLPSQEKSHAS